MPTTEATVPVSVQFVAPFDLDHRYPGQHEQTTDEVVLDQEVGQYLQSLRDGPAGPPTNLRRTMTHHATQTRAGALVQPATGTVMLWTDQGTLAHLVALDPDTARTLAAELEEAATLAHQITQESTDE